MSIRKKLVAIIGLICLVSLIVGTWFYIKYSKTTDDITQVKTLVRQTEFDKAIELTELIGEIGFPLSHYINFAHVEVGDAIKEQALCVKNNYPNFGNDLGIQNCVFWIRSERLEKTESWRIKYLEQEDKQYCKSKYVFPNGEPIVDLPIIDRKSPLEGIRFINQAENRKVIDARNADVKCNYGAFQTKMREDNWKFLISDEKDNAFLSCVEKICPIPEILKRN